MLATYAAAAFTDEIHFLDDDAEAAHPVARRDRLGRLPGTELLGALQSPSGEL